MTRRYAAVAFFAHFFALIVFRAVRDADDFNNWDLIGFLNAREFSSTWALLTLPQVHFVNPFRFPMYNAGSESTVSLLLHSAFGRISLYWSNPLVVLAHDVMFAATMSWIIAMMFDRWPPRAAAWACLSMSPVVLTFASLSAFNMQGYVSIALGLAGVEAILHARRIAGSIALASGFLLISQGYGLSFFLPVFALAWLAARSLHISTDPSGAASAPPALAANAAVALAAIVVCTLAVHVLSDGRYLAKIARLLARTASGFDRQDALAGRVDGIVDFIAVSLSSSRPQGLDSGGFFPFVLAGGGAILLAASATTSLVPLRERLARILGWTMLLGVGYVPAALGLKSQRMFFRDVFLALAVATLFGRVYESRERAGRHVPFVLAALLAVAASDAYYVASILRIDHAENHRPVFDHDRADGIARHDLTAIIRTMRDEVRKAGEVLVVHYPRDGSENATDPAVFPARFLRHFGSYRGNPRVAFACRWCDVRYGCPFPEVRRRRCARRCCRDDDAIERVQTARRDGWLWSYARSAASREGEAMVKEKLARAFEIVEPPAIVSGRWKAWRLLRRAPEVHLQ